MKKALLAGLCFVLVSLMMVNGTFALPDLNEVFADLTEFFGSIELGLPTAGGGEIDVELVSDDTPQQLFPGSEVSRTFKVQNRGTEDVFFRLVYAVQYEADSWKHLDIDFTAGEGFKEHDWQEIRISGIPYKMKVFTYTRELPAAAGSSGVTISIAMGEAVTSEQLARYRSDFLQTQVLAIDPKPFAAKQITDAEAALDKALPLNSLNPF